MKGCLNLFHLKRKKDLKFSLIICIVLIDKMIVELYRTVKNNFIY